ncbi:ABC transporter type 1, transmembrane domain-containing protein, partial [Syncephalis pseudoplumigaleata]
MALPRYLVKQLYYPLNLMIIATACHSAAHLLADARRHLALPFLGSPLVDEDWQAAEAPLQVLLLLRSALVLCMTGTLLFLRNPAHASGCIRPTEGHRVLTREFGASVWERISFSWLSSLMKAGRQSGRIEEADLWSLLVSDRSDEATKRFARHRRSGLLVSLLLTFQSDLWKQMGFACLWSLFMYSPPLFLNRLLQTISRKDQDKHGGQSTLQLDGHALDYAYLDALGLLLGTLFMSACLQQAAFYGQHIAIRTRAILSSLIFEKCLRRRVVQPVSPRSSSDRDTRVKGDESQADDAARKKPDANDAGSITNLLNVDVQHISDAFSYTHLFVGSVVQIAVALTFLSFLLGWATAFGIASMLPVYWASRHVGRNFTQVMAQLLSASDKRLSIMNETIRVIKLFAWEPQFSDRIMEAREAELRVLWQRMLMFIAFMSISMGGPVLIMSVTLGAYTAVLDRALTASVAFTTVALFNSLRRAVEQFPEMLFWLLQCRVSAQRINTFLSEEEVALAREPSATPSAATAKP